MTMKTINLSCLYACTQPVCLHDVGVNMCVFLATCGSQYVPAHASECLPHMCFEADKLHRWPPGGRQWSRSVQGKREGWQPFTKGLMRRVEEWRDCLQVRWDRESGDKEMLNTSNPLWTYCAKSRRHCPWPTMTLSSYTVQMNHRRSHWLMRETDSSRDTDRFTV